MSSDRLPFRAINPFGLRMQPDLKAQIENAAQDTHRSMNSEIVARLTASFEDKLASETQPAADSDEVSNGNLAALNAIGERAMAREGFSLVGAPAWPISRELTSGLDVDRLDRLTAIVDRTRLALGQSAARQLWPMLGLPDLRTSSREVRSSDLGPDLFSGFGAADAATTDPHSSTEAKAPKARPIKSRTKRSKLRFHTHTVEDETLTAFLRRACHITGEYADAHRATDLFAAYLRFCRANGLLAIHLNTFNRRLPQATIRDFAAPDGMRKTRFSKTKTGGYAVYRGIQIRDQWKTATNIA